MNDIAFFDNPFHLDARGRVATTSIDDHVRDLIYQVLFTSPGERVNRPDFGCGLRKLLFMGNRESLAVATQFLIQGSLERWLGDVLETKRVRVNANQEQLSIQVVYVRRDQAEQKEVAFVLPPSAS